MAVIVSISTSEANWVTRAMQTLKTDGVLVIESVVSRHDCARLRNSAARALQSIEGEIGVERLKRAGESGVIRFPLQFDSAFEILLDRTEVSSLVESFLNQHAICHLMNGILLGPVQKSERNKEKLFQSQYHRDFPRHLGGKPLSINSFFCLSDFSEQNGSTRFLLEVISRRTHQLQSAAFKKYQSRHRLDLSSFLIPQFGTLVAEIHLMQ